MPFQTGATVAGAMADAKYGSTEQIRALPADKLVAILKDRDASVYAKAKACQRLAVVGDANAVPAIAPLLADEKLSHYARTALEPMPQGAADDALRAALSKTKGLVLVGVINSIGERGDAKSLDAVGKFLRDSDPQVAQAALQAMAKLRPPI